MIGGAMPFWILDETLLSVKKAPYNITSSRVNGEATFCFFESWRPKWGSNKRTVQAGSFNHCTRVPDLMGKERVARGRVRNYRRYTLLSSMKDRLMEQCMLF